LAADGGARPAAARSRRRALRPAQAIPRGTSFHRSVELDAAALSIKHPIVLVKVVDIFAIESDTEHIFLELNNTFCFITSYFISEDYGYECRKDASKRR
jgi:hypothetical protein